MLSNESMRIILNQRQPSSGSYQSFRAPAGDKKNEDFCSNTGGPGTKNGGSGVNIVGIRAMIWGSGAMIWGSGAMI